MLKRIQLKLEDSTWFVPFLYGVGGIALTFLTQYFGSFFRELLPEIIYLDKDSAASVLSSSFTSLMTMMTFSFSTILVVLTTYSSQFSPRTINNFLTNSASKHTLGLFIMTTVYGITNLFLIRTSDEDVVLASGISVLLVVSSIGRFFCEPIAENISFRYKVPNGHDRFEVSVTALLLLAREQLDVARSRGIDRLSFKRVNRSFRDDIHVFLFDRPSLVFDDG